MNPLLELLLNPFAGSGVNGVSLMFYAGIILLIGVWRIERSFK